MSCIKGPDHAQNCEFERIVNQYQKTLLRMCYLYLRDKTLAEDAVQETFIKVYKNLQTFRGDGSEKSWIMRIAMNTCHDIRRSRWLKLIDPRFTLDTLPEASEPFKQEEEDLVEELMQLPHKLREVVLLYYYQDMTVAEIADSLGIAQSTVSGRMKRARDKLRILLERRDIHE